MIRWIGIVLIAASAAAAIKTLVLEPWQCNIAVKSLRDRTIAASQSPDPTTRTVTSRDLLEEARGRIRHCPPLAEMYMVAAANQRILGQNEDAVNTYTEALAVDRRPEIYSNRADVEAQLGRRDDARRDYLTGARFNIRILASIPDKTLRNEVIRQMEDSGDSPFKFWRANQWRLKNPPPDIEGPPG